MSNNIVIPVALFIGMILAIVILAIIHILRSEAGKKHLPVSYRAGLNNCGAKITSILTGVKNSLSLQTASEVFFLSICLLFGSLSIILIYSSLMLILVSLYHYSYLCMGSEYFCLEDLHFLLEQFINRLFRPGELIPYLSLIGWWAALGGVLAGLEIDEGLFPNNTIINVGRNKDLGCIENDQKNEVNLE
jgi:hypothetical protein